MTPHALQALTANGEDSRHQFKRDFAHADSLAAELVAFANGLGGVLLIGVNDDGSVQGLSGSDVARLNQMLSNAASQHIKPAINPVSTNVRTENGLVMVVEVQSGLNKPYMDQQGRMWVKSGADKRQVTAREEMQRLFQQTGSLHADTSPVPRTSMADLDVNAFTRYFERRYDQTPASTGLAFDQLLHSLNLLYQGACTLAGLLLFGKAPSVHLPAFVVKAVSFPGTVLHDSHYNDSEDIDGPLPEQYQRCMAFIKRNLRHVQGQQGFNSPGQLEVPPAVFEELLVNALVHRDYFISAPVRLLIFADRIEITSPGHLPNHLDTEQIRFGLSNLRNPTLASHAFHLLPYRGLGTGIPRAVAAWQQVQLLDDQRSHQFKAIIQRPGHQPEQDAGVNEGVNEGVSEGVSALQHLIAQQPGLRAPALARALGTAPKNIERWLRQLRQAGMVEFRGAPKTGGYHLTTPQGVPL